MTDLLRIFFEMRRIWIQSSFFVFLIIQDYIFFFSVFVVFR